MCKTAYFVSLAWEHCSQTRMWEFSENREENGIQRSAD